MVAEVVTVIEKYILKELIPNLDKTISKECGIPRDRRIGLFGRHRRIDMLCNAIASDITSRGFALITGWKVISKERSWDMTYLLSKTHVRVPTGEKEIPYKITADAVVKGMICDPHYYMHFVTLCSKAIIDLKGLGAQVFEMFGCYLKRIPMLGFLELTESEFRYWKDKIEDGCEYARIDTKVIECVCPGKLCPAKKPGDCVFSNYEFWWSARQLFYFPGNRLVASLGIPREIIIDFIISHK